MTDSVHPIIASFHLFSTHLTYPSMLVFIVVTLEEKDEY